MYTSKRQDSSMANDKFLFIHCQRLARNLEYETNMQKTVCKQPNTNEYQLGISAPD